jgi:hypothetical protein
LEHGEIPDFLLHVRFWLFYFSPNASFSKLRESNGAIRDKQGQMKVAANATSNGVTHAGNTIFNKNTL